MNPFEDMIRELRELQAIATPEAIKEEPEAAARMFKSMTELFIAATTVIQATPRENLPAAEMGKFMETALMVMLDHS